MRFVNAEMKLLLVKWLLALLSKRDTALHEILFWSDEVDRLHSEMINADTPEEYFSKRSQHKLSVIRYLNARDKIQ